MNGSTCELNEKSSDLQTTLLGKSVYLSGAYGEIVAVWLTGNRLMAAFVDDDIGRLILKEATAFKIQQQ
jgi:hypothetical protein